MQKANVMRATAMQGLVRRRLTHETRDRVDREAQREAAERFPDKMCAHLSRRIGQEGFRTLLARALTGLRLATVPAPGAVALVAYRSALPVTFIGEDLTFRTLSVVWTEIDWGLISGIPDRRG